jgi:hypothetical protein
VPTGLCTLGRRQQNSESVRTPSNHPGDPEIPEPIPEVAAVAHPRRAKIGRLFAELAVIVLGVLLALAADRWNQSRQDRDASVDYGRRLVTELAADSVRIHREVDRANATAAACLSLLDLVSGSGLEAQAPALYRNCVAASELPYGGGSTFQEIRNTGSLDLLVPEVRQALFDYYGFVDVQLRRLQDIRDLGWVPLSEAAYGTGAWLPDGSLTAEEWLARLRAYPDIEERINRAIGWRQTSAFTLQGWERLIGNVLMTIRD